MMVPSLSGRLSTCPTLPDLIMIVVILVGLLPSATAQASNTVQTLPFDTCKTQLKLTDAPPHGVMTQEEYLGFANQLRYILLADPSVVPAFTSLPFQLQQSFKELSTGGVIDVFGVRPGETPSAAQTAQLQKICNVTASAFAAVVENASVTEQDKEETEGNGNLVSAPPRKAAPVVVQKAQPTNKTEGTYAPLANTTSLPLQQLQPNNETVIPSLPPTGGPPNNTSQPGAGNLSIPSIPPGNTTQTPHVNTTQTPHVGNGTMPPVNQNTNQTAVEGNSTLSPHANNATYGRDSLSTTQGNSTVNSTGAALPTPMKATASPNAMSSINLNTTTGDGLVLPLNETMSLINANENLPKPTVSPTSMPVATRSPTTMPTAVTTTTAPKEIPTNAPSVAAKVTATPGVPPELVQSILDGSVTIPPGVAADGGSLPPGLQESLTQGGIQAMLALMPTPVPTPAPTPLPTATGTHIVTVNSSFIISNTIGMSELSLSFGPDRQGLNLAYQKLAQQVVANMANAGVVAPTSGLRRRRARQLQQTVDVTMDPQYAEIYLVTDSTCPHAFAEAAAEKTSKKCQTAFGHYDLFVVPKEVGGNIDTQGLYNQYVSATQGAIDKGLLTEQIKIADPGSLLTVEGASVPVNSPPHGNLIGEGFSENDQQEVASAEPGVNSGLLYAIYATLGSLGCVILIIAIVEGIRHCRRITTKKGMDKLSDDVTVTSDELPLKSKPYRVQVETLLQKVAPHDLGKLDDLMEQFQGRELLLIDTLEQMEAELEQQREELGLGNLEEEQAETAEALAVLARKNIPTQRPGVGRRRRGGKEGRGKEGRGKRGEKRRDGRGHAAPDGRRRPSKGQKSKRRVKEETKDGEQVIGQEGRGDEQESQEDHQEPEVVQDQKEVAEAAQHHEQEHQQEEPERKSEPEVEPEHKVEEAQESEGVQYSDEGQESEEVQQSDEVQQHEEEPIPQGESEEEQDYPDQEEQQELPDAGSDPDAELDLT